MIRTEQAHLKVAADSHPGMKGKNNEDSYAVSAYRLSEKNATPVLLAVISDGIGGHRAGEVASGIAVDIISKRVAASDGARLPEVLKEAIEKASDEIYEKSLEAPERKGMGATCAIVCIIANRLYATNIGDSRIHLIRNGTIQQISTDHTWIQEALDSGLLKPDQVEGHPNAHVIRRYLGGPTHPKVDMRLRLSPDETDIQAEINQGTPLQAGDRILLCSDGLTDLVKPHEILSIVQEQPLETAVKSLIDLANQRGGHDNITIILLDIPASAIPVSEPVVEKKFPISWQWATVGCLGLLILASAAVIVALSMGMLGPNVLSRATATPTVAATQLPSLPAKLSPTTAFTDTPQPTPTPTMTETVTSTATETATSTLTPTETTTTGETTQVSTMQGGGGTVIEATGTNTKQAPSGPTHTQAPPTATKYIFPTPKPTWTSPPPKPTWTTGPKPTVHFP